ncbi:hypothetical protein ACTFBT_01055 [Streptomyces microflavus]|uniref:Uncharacterized protein n=1 Tax=Streptomyces microflavus TaxID=1919 RepID=A0A7J0D475_STRMI|nr:MULTISPECIES: hypothetical protein [Streptomyces]MDX2978185.1 hypothetical protein [Streptomyces sp. NRRL_B-2249]GFN09522.1 hypothetical protein Smic_80780 [Streptomyces microflavus]GGX67399.1 hypothetical protein GCM10010298_35210 [Streptomyces microflavus]
MNDREITDLWVEIVRDIGPSSATAVQRLMTGMAERQETRIRAQVADDLRTKAARDWPAIGRLLERIIAVVERGPNGEPVEG